MLIIIYERFAKNFRNKYLRNYSWTHRCFNSPRMACSCDSEHCYNKAWTVKMTIAVIYNVHSLCVEINSAYETKLAYDVVGTRFDSKDQATRYLRCISTFKITKFTDVKAFDSYKFAINNLNSLYATLRCQACMSHTDCHIVSDY